MPMSSGIEAPGRSHASCMIVLPDQKIQIPASAYTLEGFRAWVKSGTVPERGRLTFIDQDILIDMTPEEYEAHGQVKAEVSHGVYALVVAQDLGKFFPDGTLLTNEAAGISNGPDAAFASWESFESGRVRLVPQEAEADAYLELEGVPDWVLEVVSDSSVAKDTRRLFAAYHRAGIPEYWLIDARGPEIDFRILWHRPEGYAPAPLRRGWQRSQVFRQRFRLERRRDRIGLWQYQLRVKP